MDATDAAQIQEVAVDVASLLGGLALGLLAGVLGAAVVVVVLRWALRRKIAMRHMARKCRRPLVASGGVLGMRGGLVVAMDTGAAPVWADLLRHGLTIVFLLCLMWLAIALISAVEDTALDHFGAESMARGSRGRRVQTQAQILNRVAVAVVLVVGLAAILLTFPAARTFGASILASAGIASVVVGLAAQSVLGNVFAGLQIAFTDSLRIDDTVVVEGEQGNVEDMTLTYVVVRTWDERRMILPSSHFTTTPFLNYTKTSESLTGTVELDVDWSVPIAAVRAETLRLAQACPDWDGRSVSLDVTDAVGGTVRLRASVTAADSGKLWGVRTFVREGLVEWLQANAPYAVAKRHLMSHEPPAAWTALSPADMSTLREDAAELEEAVAAERRENTFDLDARALRQGVGERPAETMRMMARAARRRAEKADRRRAREKRGALGRADREAFLAEPSADSTRVLTGLPLPEDLPEPPPVEPLGAAAPFGAVPSTSGAAEHAAAVDGPRRPSVRDRLAALGRRAEEPPGAHAPRAHEGDRTHPTEQNRPTEQTQVTDPEEETR